MKTVLRQLFFRKLSVLASKACRVRILGVRVLLRNIFGIPRIFHRYHEFLFWFATDGNGILSCSTCLVSQTRVICTKH